MIGRRGFITGLVSLVAAGPAPAQDLTVTGKTSLWFTAPAASSLSITLSANRGPMVTIKADGTIEYGPDYTPDAAAKAFWDTIGAERLARNCQ